MKKLLELDLRLFDGEGATAAGPAAASDGNQGETQGTVPGNTRRGKSGDLSNVRYGKQPAAAEDAAVGTVTEAQSKPQVAAADASEVQVTSDAMDERRRAFRDLVNGQYKDVYTEETQRMINRRFKETEDLRKKVEDMQPLSDMLFERYGVKDGDLKKLTEAIENDNAYWSEAADAAGMDVEQYKAFQKLKRENEALRRAEEEQRAQKHVQTQVADWVREAEAIKTKFPKFDFQKEIQDPQFMSMLKSGVPVEHAYKVMHYDELLGDAVNVTAANTQQAVVANVRARGARPQENGTMSQSPFTIKDDPSNWSNKDIDEVVRRVARGEEVYL